MSTGLFLHLSHREVDLRSKSGEGFCSLMQCGPSPGLRRTMLRIAGSNPTSPRWGEVKERFCARWNTLGAQAHVRCGVDACRALAHQDRNIADGGHADMAEAARARP